MRSGPLPLAGFGCAALAAGLGFLLTSPAELPASSSGLVALADADGDLLDDALELRLGTNPNQADSDLDGRSDLEERLLGTDPNRYDDVQTQPVGTTSFALEVYQVGPDFVFEFFALVSDRVHTLEIFQGTVAEQRSFRWSELRPWQVDAVTAASSVAGFHLQRARMRVESAWVDAYPSVAFGAVATLDQTMLADSVELTHSGGYLAQLELTPIESSTRGAMGGHGGASFGELSGGSSAGGGASQKTGGLFPVEPGGGGTSNGTADEICVQTLVPIANLGGGRVQYVVATANCDPEPDAVCMPGCALTKDDVIVAIDVIGLLGG